MVPINFSRGPLQFIRIAIKYNWVLLFLGFLWIEIEDSCCSVYKIPIHFHSCLIILIRLLQMQYDSYPFYSVI